MRRFYGAAVLLSVLGLCLTISPVSAHVLKIDGDIAAILHINPDDNPTNGKPTQYLLYFTDDSGKFSLPKCNCRVNIQENGQTIGTQPVNPVNSLDSSNIYTFPKADVYNLQVSGQPKQPNAFQPFILNYLVRVGSVNHQSLPPLLGVGMGLMIGLVLLGGYASEHNTKIK